MRVNWKSKFQLFQRTIGFSLFKRAGGGRGSFWHTRCKGSTFLDHLSKYHRLSALSPREREVFHLVLRGLGNREIEERLFISLPTVKNHIYSIFRKLRLHSRVELITRYYDLRHCGYKENSSCEIEY